MSLSRRSFLTGLIAMPAIVKIGSLMPVKAIPNIIGETEFGFTFGNISNLSEIITQTLRKNAKLIADNITENNAFLLKIKNRDYVKINYLDPDVQTQRMIAKLSEKGKNKELWAAKNETYEEIAKRQQLEADNRDKWDNKFTWYSGYQNINSLIRSS